MTCVYETNPSPDDCQAPDSWEGAPAEGGEILFEPTQIYEGYVVYPPSPLLQSDDSVTLFVQSFDDSSITGAIVFGSGAIPAPATDPLHAYLPEEFYPEHQEENDAPPWPMVWPGYALSLRDGRVDGTRVRFTVHPIEQWRGWCELLAGYPNGLCVPSTELESLWEPTNSGGAAQIWDPLGCEDDCSIDGIRYDCGKFLSCTGGDFPEWTYCSCKGCGCTASTVGPYHSFDLQLRDTGALEGAMDLTLVYLTPSGF